MRHSTTNTSGTLRRLPPLSKPPARGWGSPEERRLMLWGAAGFFLLGVYAAANVLIAVTFWS